jgi:uncharacterized repeat protein (TIGR01451 family)
MKNLLSYLPKKTLIFLASILAVIGIGAGALAGFGPDRPTYTWAKPADHITFNSITDNPVVGDERAFLSAAGYGSNSYSDPLNNVKDGDVITLRVYYHNNAASNLNLVATNTKVRIALPTGTAATQQVTGYISADNATPQVVTDTLDVTATNNSSFELSYVAGSARLDNNVFTNGVTLPDSIVSTGTLIGYDQLNGRLPGCSEYSGWITLKVKVNMPRYTIDKQAKLVGEGADAWRETVNTTTGATVQWLVTVRNTGNTTLDNITVLDQVPTNMTVVKGSVKLINTAYPSTNPFVYPDSAIQANGRQVNVEIGGYLPGGTAYLRIDTVVTDVNALACGANHFTNEAFATATGHGTIHDYAYADITKDCGQPVYSCNSLNVTKVTGRQIKADVATTASNGASLSTITYTFGDGSTDLVTTNSSVNYTYTKDGTFTVKAVPSFKIGNQTFTASSASCVKSVTFSSTPTPTPTPPKELPNTGAGSVLGIFAGTTIVSAVGYRLWAVRRLGR